MNSNFKTSLSEGLMSRLQYKRIFICFLMNILESVNVMVISYCSPAISKAWNIGPGVLGMIFSLGLSGMTIGALFLAPFADNIGRKKMILINAVLMGLSIFLTTWTDSISQLIVLRFVSGIGIGSMLASTAAITAEFAPNRSRDFWVSFVISGYPVGAVLSGIVAAYIVPTMDWEVMFKLAGLASFVTLPLLRGFLSETLEFYLSKQPVGALEKINHILSKMNQEKIQIFSQKKFKQAKFLLESC